MRVVLPGNKGKEYKCKHVYEDIGTTLGGNGKEYGIYRCLDCNECVTDEMSDRMKVLQVLAVYAGVLGAIVALPIWLMSKKKKKEPTQIELPERT